MCKAARISFVVRTGGDMGRWLDIYDKEKFFSPGGFIQNLVTDIKYAAYLRVICYIVK